jgi:putative endonuclease
VNRGWLGRSGERRAARHLERQGLRILARNWRSAHGELDLIARDGEQLVVVEVRTAGSRPFTGRPELSVGPQKQRRLARLAQIWLRGTTWRPRGVRFDVVGVQRLSWWRWEVRWFKNAFDVPG